MSFYRNLIFGLFCILLLAGGCAAERLFHTGEKAVVPAANGLPWPPSPAPQRSASDFQIQLDGTEYTAAGGNTAEMGTDLMLVGGGVLPWTFYSIGDLGAGNELVSIATAHEVLPDAPDDGTMLHFGVANYDLGRWEWIPAPTAEEPWVCDPAEVENYRNALGDAHLVVVLDGPGTGRMETVTFTREFNTHVVPRPENLTAAALVPQEVQLNWDVVPDAEGYNVYRACHEEFLEFAQINSELVADNSYTDVTNTDGSYYYYYVTAVASNESGPSNYAGAWCFGADLPAPYDLTVSDRGTDNFTVTWKWDKPAGSSIYGFVLYIDTVPDFTLDSETMRPSTTFSSARQHTFYEIEEGVTYFWKLCAQESMGGPLGRMSAELSGTSTGFWTWGDVETIAEGQPPVRAVVGDGVVAVSYFNGSNVDFAIQDGDGWRVEIPLYSSLRMPEDDPTNPNYSEAGPFTEQLDVCYGAGKYMVAGYGSKTGDCWVAEWDTADDPGSWDAYRIHGDGTWNLSPRSGLHATLAASDTEFGLLQYYLSEGQLFLHTQDIASGTWTEVIIRDDYDPGATLSHSIQYHNGNLYILQTDNLTDELFFGDRDGGWSWQDVRGEGVPKLSKHNDLQRFNNEWYTPGFYSSGKDLYLLNGTDLPWTGTQIAGDGEDAGYFARMAVEGEEAIVIHYTGGKYNFGLYSDAWEFYSISVPGVTDYDSDADVVLLDGIPALVFRDETDGMIKIARGIPPAG